MQVIKPMIKPGDTGPQVANLTEALILLVEGGVFETGEAPIVAATKKLDATMAKAREEMAERKFGPATERLLRDFQLRQALGKKAYGVVEEKTAAKLNEILTDLGVVFGEERNDVRFASSAQDATAERWLGKADLKDRSVSQAASMQATKATIKPGNAGAQIDNARTDIGALDGRKRFRLQGRVILSDKRPARGYVVRVFDRDLRHKELLGEVRTGPDGSFEVPYGAHQFKRAEKDRADIVVRVFAPRDVDDQLLVESPIFFNALPVTDIGELQISDRGGAEFERILHSIEPLLTGQGPHGSDLPIADLNDKDIDFLAGESGIERGRLAWLSKAFIFAARTRSLARNDRSVVSSRVLATLFYGWFREALPDDWERLIQESVVTLRRAARLAIDRGIIPAQTEASVDACLGEIPNPKRDALQTTATIAGFGKESLSAVLEHVGSISEVDNSLVTRLVAEGAIQEREAHRIGLGLTAHDLAGGDEATMTAIVGSKPARLGGSRLARARDLAALDAAEIHAALVDAKVEPPDGITVGDYAARLRAQIAELFPTDTLLNHATTVSQEVVSALERVVVAPAQDRNGESSASRDADLSRFINLHPGLGLDQVVDEAHDSAAALRTIKERVGWVDRLRDLNPDLDLFAIDYLPESESLKQVKFDGLSCEARAMVVANFKAYQRIQSLDAGALDGIELLKAGYHSSTTLARSLPSEIVARTGLPVSAARAYHEQAEQKATQAALTWFAAHGLERDARLIKHRSFAEAPAYLKQLPGYTDLFGSVDFCRCDHCQSVLGPAAYFVDLMYFVERHILKPSFESHEGEKNALHLRSRRPDLWSLGLSCENTNAIVPTLDVVIDILEKCILKDKQFASVAELYEKLANVDHSISLPFSLPLERLCILLSHLTIDRSEVAGSLLLSDADMPVRARIRLGMLPKQFEVITKSRLVDIGSAQRFYAAWLKSPQLTLSANAAEVETKTLDRIGVPHFSSATGLDRLAVSDVLTTNFVNGAAAGAPERISVVAGIASSGGVQNDSESVVRLTAGRLDRFERFVRLWRHIPWTVAELDYVIARLGKNLMSANANNALDASIVVALGWLLDVQDRLQLPVDELCAQWDQVPAIPLRGASSLFDRAFNLSPFVQQQGRWPDAGKLINASSDIRARLSAALQIDDQELTALKEGLDPCLGRIDVDAQGNQAFVSGTWLNERNLALLYRHTRLARLLKLSIQDLLQTIALTGSVAAKAANERCISSLSDLQAVLQFHSWRAASGFNLAEIRFITKSASTLPGYETPGSLAARIAAEVLTEKSLEISAELFTQIGVTQSQSATVIADNCKSVGGNPALFETIPGEVGYRIVSSIGVKDIAASLVFDVEPGAALVATVGRDVYRIVQRGGEGGFEAAALVDLGLSEIEADALVAANVSTAANDRKPFEKVSNSSKRYRLRSTVSEADAITAFGTNAQDIAATRSIVRHRAVNLVVSRHCDSVLAAKASMVVKATPEKTRALLNLARPSTAEQQRLLVEALQGGPLSTLSDIVETLIRYTILFKAAPYDSNAVEFIDANRAVVAMSEPPTAETVRRVAQYATLAADPDPAYEPAAPTTDRNSLHAVLAWPGSIATAATDTAFAQLAKALKTDVPQVKDLLAQVTFPSGTAVVSRLDELTKLKRVLALARRLGVAGEILSLVVSEDHAKLTRAAEGVFGAVRAKYPDEKMFREKLEPFDDRLRSRKRDGVVEYLLSAPDDGGTDWRRRFLSASDLYHHFLTDVMVEGCARTSKVVGAISSVQLYVHRVLMNLEQSQGQGGVAARFDEPRYQDEWWWRKNYQVWVANRKVFLFPENYIEPGLRDDKTPLFTELEDTLLQQQITEQNVLDAYSKYLHGFEEVGRLRIAGAYHDRQGAAGDLLHLFGVTSSDPPVYYYRTIRNLENKAGPVFSAWQKIDLQIPVRKVSPVVHLGRLYVFWVETTTRPLSEFENGSSQFQGYRHSLRTKFSVLRLDAQWAPPRVLKVMDETGTSSDVRVVDDPFSLIVLPVAGSNISGQQGEQAKKGYKRVRWDIRERDHTKPIESYTPEGPLWDRVYPEVVTSDNGDVIRLLRRPFGVGAELVQDIDLWRACTVPSAQAWGLEETLAITVTEANNRATLSEALVSGSLKYDAAATFPFGGMSFRPPVSLAETALPVDCQMVNGAEGTAIVEVSGDSLIIQRQTGQSAHYVLRRIGTTIASNIGEIAVSGGINRLLDIQRQEKLNEAPPPLKPLSTALSSRLESNPVGAENPLLTYFRELFFHIPFSISDHLNSQQKFADAQRWYHYLFNPTANDGADEKTRPWRYREFREKGIESFREAMTDPNALSAYRRDPFNPHAIARLRPGAYQKAIFMKYIDNLLDWGDSLFSQFTMESVNEATMLYVMAADILGPRPAELGACAVPKANSYMTIVPLLNDATDFLIEEFEMFDVGAGRTPFHDHVFVPDKQPKALARKASPVASLAAGGEPPVQALANPAGWSRAGAQTWKGKTGIPLMALSSGNLLGGASMPRVGGQAAAKPASGDPVAPPGATPGGAVPSPRDGRFGPLGLPQGLERGDYIPDVKYGLFDVNDPNGKIPPKGSVSPPGKIYELPVSRLVFCFPENKELRAYWDRVEDRLYKVRNCMDIAGVRRRLELFAPEIDPRMLVRMRAAGLTLDDVMNVTSGNVPPYRFTYLVEKAKQYAALVQSFGGKLLDALKERDGEELTRLRTVHEQNLLKLRSQMTQWEVDAAEDTLESLNRQKAATEYRRDHFLNLVSTGLTPWERTQQVATHAGGASLETAALLYIAAGGVGILPQIGAPTSMKYGGDDLHKGLAYAAGSLKVLGDLAELTGKSAGIEASFQRREEDWTHQVELAKREIEQLDKQISAAEIRRDIAKESLTVHQRAVDQAQEIFEFLRDRFTNFGRFTWLSAELQKLHRTAFNAALSMARQAEQACQFERPDEGAVPALDGDYWDVGNAGLLAGDRLLLDLHNIERRYIETYRRSLEIEQSFSLARFDPDALSKLKTNCVCEFEIPEWFFDLSYPGLYRRRIKGVHLTIPSVVGPHTSVGATLRLISSHIRKEPKLDSEVPVPLRHMTAIAASTGHADAGVFEFNFRDERYMPFEGAGVNSKWELSLPKAVKPFDYRTISDVILRLSYTAEEDAALREDAEKVAGTLAKLTSTGVIRTLSLRTEFPEAWQVLVQGAKEVQIDLRDSHIPFFMSAFDLAAARFDVLMDAELPGNVEPKDVEYPGIEFDSESVTGKGPDTASGLYLLGRTGETSVLSTHVMKISSWGSLSRQVGGKERVDTSRLRDIMLRVTLKRKTTPGI